MNEIAVNARFRSRPLTGVERFASGVCRVWSAADDHALDEIVPSSPCDGLRGHAWEQFQLPSLVGDRVLFSPCNTGPVSVKNQLVVIHDAAVWDVPEGFRTSFRLLYQRLLPALARRARKIATVSQFSRERLAERLRISPDRIAVLGNGIDERFCPSSTRETEHEPFLLCVGSLDPRKNLDRLLSAWLRLRKEGRIPERFQLKIIGSQNLRNFARVNSSDGNGVEWLGRLDDATLIDHYRSATAFVFPSLYEGFGLPPLEAMACGCPVVLSHAASIPEVGGPEFNPGLPPSDGTALYFDPLSEDELCRQLETVVRLGQDQRRILIENALARTRQFSWESVAFKASEEICQLL